ncbi:transmembrane protein [Ceratobasidium sp. AG-Ba]|nr:transmembrane protein [Ceratobasidium sp. AG-Ba]
MDILTWKGNAQILLGAITRSSSPIRGIRTIEYSLVIVSSPRHGNVTIVRQAPNLHGLCLSTTTPPIGRIFSPRSKLALRPPRSQPRRDGPSCTMSKSDAGYIPLPAYSSRPASPASYPNSPLPGYHDQHHGRLGESYRAAVEALNADPRFSTEEPQTWQRVVLLLIMAALFYAAFHLKSASFLGMEDS